MPSDVATGGLLPVATLGIAKPPVSVHVSVLSVVIASSHSEGVSDVELAAFGKKPVTWPLMPFVAMIVPPPVALSDAPLPTTIAAVVLVPLVMEPKATPPAPKPTFAQAVQACPVTAWHTRTSAEVTL